MVLFICLLYISLSYPTCHNGSSFWGGKSVLFYSTYCCECFLHWKFFLVSPSPDFWHCYWAALLSFVCWSTKAHLNSFLHTFGAHLSIDSLEYARAGDAWRWKMPKVIIKENTSFDLFCFGSSECRSIQNSPLEWGPLTLRLWQRTDLLTAFATVQGNTSVERISS